MGWKVALLKLLFLALYEFRTNEVMVRVKYLKATEE